MNKTNAILVAIAIVVVIGAFYAHNRSSSSSTATSPEAMNNNSDGCVTGRLTASGSTALAPLAQEVAQKYQAKCKAAQITINLGGSGTGLTNVETSVSDIGNSDVFSKPGQEDLIDHQVAIVIFGLMVNSQVQVDSLTTKQIQDIYAGNVTNWKQVGGNDLPIVVVSRPPSSGTRATFQNYILGGPETISGPANLTTDSNGTVIKNVQQTAGAIGYAGTGPIKEAGLKILKIDGLEAISSNVANNSYKYWNIEHMYTKGQPTQIAQAFIDYMASEDAKAAATALDYMAVSDVPADILATHQKH
ncbi:MAG: phosphate ABC transporter substrate-binding protein [Candidatus Andersenbacteria bacterium]